MGNRSTLTFFLQPKSKLLQQIRAFGTPIFLMSAILFLVRPNTMPPAGSASFQLAGTLQIPGDSSSSLAGVRMLAYSDQDQNGKVSTPDLLVASSNTDPKGRFFLHIEETRTLVSDIREERGDAWEISLSGKTYVASRYLPSPIQGEKISGFRFREIFVPTNAVITAAFLQFTASTDILSPHSVLISTEQSAHPGPFSVSSEDLSRRNKGPIQLRWEFKEQIQGKKYQSPDLSSLIVPLVQQEDWRSGQEIVFLVAGEECLLSARNRQGKGARLVIHYSLPDSPFLLIADSTTLPPMVHVPSHQLAHASDTSLQIPTYFNPQLPLRHPHVWEDLHATHKDGSVTLSWSYAQSSTKTTFEILRSSNGINYERIGIVPSQTLKSTDSPAISPYSFLDASPKASQSPVLAYRIRASSHTGPSTYSKVLKVQMKPDETSLFLAVKEAKTEASLQVSYFSKHPGPAQLEVIDITGQTFQQLPIASTPHIQSMTLWTMEWPKGLYYLHLQQGSNSVMRPYVVK